MQTGAQRKRVTDAPPVDPAGKWLTESLARASTDSEGFSPYGRPPRLDLGIEWTSAWQEFWSSVRDFFFGERAPKETDLPADSELRIDWVGGKNSPWAFALSSLWHVSAVVLAALPVWGFLPAAAGNLAPVQMEVNWNTAQDLPPIHLAAPEPPALAAKRIRPLAPKIAEDKPPARNGADAVDPGQTILSMPIHATHPRQTLIQPDAPIRPPKIEPELPNIVEWAASEPLPKLQMQFEASAAAPKLRPRAANAAVAPEVANLEKNAGSLNIASSPVVNPAPQMPMAPMAAMVQPRGARENSNAGAPEVGGASGDPNLRSVIALSATPAPPAPEVAVPLGNLAARVAISPAGTEPGSPGGTGSSKTGASRGGDGKGSGVSAVGPGGPGSVPAAVSVSGGNGHATASGGGSSAAGPVRSKLVLKPMGSLPASLEPANPRGGPANLASLGPNEPPERILAGKEVYTLHVNLPNLTSASGSWILNFAQLDEQASPFPRPKGVLSGPVPVHKVDPKYPPATIKENIEGEVVLYAIIRADGSVDSIQIVRKLDSRLDSYAIQALAQWKFRPATRDGAPVDVEAVVHIPFQYHLPQP